MVNQEKESIRVAVIGYGLGGEAFHAPLISTTPGLKLAAIVTNNAQRREKAVIKYPGVILYRTVEGLWKDASEYDLVVVTTPNRFHVPLGIAALEAGLHAVIDKPMAATPTDAERLIAASKKTGKLLSVYQNRRWDGDFLTIRSIMKQDLLGPIARYESRFDRYRPVVKESWKESDDMQDAGGNIYDLGSHLIDQALQLFGKPTRVYAELPKRRVGAKVDDDSFVALTFASGIHAHLWMSTLARLLEPTKRLTGIQGTFEKWGLDPQEDALRSGEQPGGTDWGKEPEQMWGHISSEIKGLHIDGKVETLPGAYPQFYRLLRDAILKGGPVPVDPESALPVIQVIAAAQESHRTGSVISL